MVSIRRIVTYNIFIITTYQWLQIGWHCIYINVLVQTRLGSSRAVLASDVGDRDAIAILSHEDGIRSVDSFSSEDVAVTASSSTSTGSQTATWRRSLT